MHRNADSVPGTGNGHHADGRSPSFWRSRGSLVAIGFFLAVAFLLFSEHRAHVLGYLPFLLLLACPLMHLFMHHGHGHHGGNGAAPRPGADAPPLRREGEVR
ncbi:DUF2933 domain-containing protein [Xanthobacter autotrophicus]|uniref:DUF2933 domain-containing protein n=2 Tax=Xanthobacteraceae TaxID=335928 RepID=UPI003D7FC9F9